MKSIETLLTDILFFFVCLLQEQSHKSYRPLCVLTFRWNYATHGLDPLGYHLVNVILHIVVSVLYFRWVYIYNIKLIFGLSLLMFTLLNVIINLELYLAYG